MEENLQVQNCCCSLKRLATTIQGGFPDNSLPEWFTWNGRRNEARTTAQQINSSLKAPGTGFVKVPKGTIPFWYKFLSIPCASTNTDTAVSGTRSRIWPSYRLTWPKRSCFGHSKSLSCATAHILVLSPWQGWEWEGGTAMDSRTTPLDSKVTGNVHPEQNYQAFPTALEMTKPELTGLWATSQVLPVAQLLQTRLSSDVLSSTCVHATSFPSTKTDRAFLL